MEKEESYSPPFLHLPAPGSLSCLGFPRVDVAAKLRLLLQQKYSGIFLGSNGTFLTGRSSFSQEERCIYPAVHREMVWWAQYSSRRYTLNTCPQCWGFLVPLLGGSENSAFSSCVLCSYMEVSWLSPAVVSALGHSCPSWQLSDGFLIWLFLGLSGQLLAGRERLSCLMLSEGSKASLCHLPHFYGTKELGSMLVWSEVPAAVGHVGYRQHICPPAKVVCYWPVLFVPRAASFVSLHLGPRLSDPTLLCWAPYHPNQSLASAVFLR